VPRKSRAVSGVKGHNIKRNYLAGKPRPAGGGFKLEFGAYLGFEICDLGF